MNIRLLEYWSRGNGGHPIWLSGVEPNICGVNMEGCGCCDDGDVLCEGCGKIGNIGRPVTTGMAGTPLLP